MFGSSFTGASGRLAAGIGLALVLALPAGCGEAEDAVAPDTTMRIDGELADWRGTPGARQLTVDPEGDGRDQSAQAAAIAPGTDLVSVRAAHDAERLYFLLELGAPSAGGASVEYTIYLDADGKTETGYVVGDEAIGADFVVSNGTLLQHASTDRTAWEWKTLEWRVEELESAGPDHAIELSIDRRAIQAPGGGGGSIGLLFSTIEPHDTSTWEDDVTDFAPDRAGRPGRLAYSLSALASAQPAVPPPRPAVAGIRNYLLYNGAWDRSVIEKVYRYDLVILDAHRGPRPSQIGPVVRRIRAGVNGLPGDADDVIVLGSITMGEDVRTYGDRAPAPGDGGGPAYWDPAGEQLLYEQQGVAAYYLDEKTGPEELPGPDGLPDRNGSGGSCFVNPGDPEWRAFLVGNDGRTGAPYSAHLLLDVMGYQGLLLDTPEVAGPWYGYGYTAEGMYQAIASLRESFPGAVLLLNRGQFFFVPQFPVQYRWNPRKLIDIGLYDSHYLDSDYGEGEAELPYHLSPLFASSSLFFDQKIQAELGRPDDSFEVMLSLDYAADPDSLSRDHPQVYGDAIASSLQSYGRVPLITTRLIDATPTLTLEEAAPEDVEAPRWGNTTVGFSTLLPEAPPPYMVAGFEDTVVPAPRVGVQKAIPGDGQVTLRWDVALDQTLPVRYNIYYSDLWPFDLGLAEIVNNVPTEVGADYAERSLTSADDGCPYQATVTGLENGRTYYFVVRAEDSTPGTPFDQGRGPGGGREDENLNLLAAMPRAPDPAPLAIAIDGNFDDWEAVAGYLDAEAEAEQLRPDWIEVRFAEDADAYFVFFETVQPIEPAAGYQVFVNADGQSWTGLHSRGGADYQVRNGNLLRYAGSGGNDAWVTVGPVALARNGGRTELLLPRAALAVSGEGPVWSFVGARTAGAVDTLPEQGAGFYLPRPPAAP